MGGGGGDRVRLAPWEAEQAFSEGAAALARPVSEVGWGWGAAVWGESRVARGTMAIWTSGSWGGDNCGQALNDVRPKTEPPRFCWVGRGVPRRRSLSPGTGA